ncbi:hypothetical protein Peur_041142 [Populus x canadensis]
MGQFTWECQRITTFLPATMAVKSTKLSGACSLEKEGEILSKLDGCPGVKQCYGEDVLYKMRSRRASKVHEFGSVQSNKKTSLRGNPMYVSPEIVKNSMLTAKPPWILKTDRKKDPDSVTRIGSTHESPAIPNNISEEGKNFIRYCYAKSPAWRSTASEVSS